MTVVGATENKRSLADLTSREAVLSAMDEYDRVGRSAFLVKYGFGEASQYVATDGKRVYDPEAIAGAAVAYQFPGTKPPTPKDVVGDVAPGAVGRKLESLGFRMAETGSLSAGQVRALVDVRDGELSYESPEETADQQLAPLLEAGLVLRGEGRALLLSPEGRQVLEGVLAEGEGLLLPQAEVDAFAETLSTDEYKRHERNYKWAVHLALKALLEPERLAAPEFPALLSAFFSRRLDLEILGLTEDDRDFVEDAVNSSTGLTNAFANLCGGGFGVNSFVWIPGAVEDGLGARVAEAFEDLLNSSTAISGRVDRFRAALLDVQREAQNGASWHENWTPKLPSLAFVAAILGAFDPQQFCFYLQGKLRPAYREFSGDWPSGSMGEIYERVADFVADVGDALRRQGAPARDLIDAQSFLYLRDPAVIGADPLAESVATFREDYPYNEEEKAEKAIRSLALAEETRPALSEEALVDPDWDAISRAISSTLHGNLGPAKSAPLRLIASGTDEERETFADAIRTLLHGNGDLVARLDAFLRADLPGIRETVAMKLLSIADPDRVLHAFRVQGPNGKAELMTLSPVSLEAPGGGSTAELAVRTNDLIRKRLTPYFGNDCYGMTRYLFWLAEQVEGEGNGSGGLEDLRKTLHLDPGGWLEDAVDLLERKRQLIFYGPPGTGKTYIALSLMKHLAPRTSQREVVQFHPSYSYEDFVRGYRPVGQEGQLTYKVVEGPLIRLAETARAALRAGDDSPHILLIDEINRGNLPRILGELLYLLEYRSEEDGVQLMYAENPDERFTLPENLWIVGTMNTADRSIGLIDAALRRRFHFKSLFPGEQPIKGTLRSWLGAHTSDDVAGQVADYVDRLNSRLMEQQGSYGENIKIGHSYFMEEALDLDLFERIWTSDVLPYLEEQLFGREVDVRRTFSLAAMDSVEPQTLGQEPGVPEGGAGSEGQGPDADVNGP